MSVAAASTVEIDTTISQMRTSVYTLPIVCRSHLFFFLELRLQLQYNIKGTYYIGSKYVHRYMQMFTMVYINVAVYFDILSPVYV